MTNKIKYLKLIAKTGETIENNTVDLAPYIYEAILKKIIQDAFYAGHYQTWSTPEEMNQCFQAFFIAYRDKDKYSKAGKSDDDDSYNELLDTFTNREVLHWQMGFQDGKKCVG